MTEPENGKCEFSVSTKLIDMHIIILYNYVLGKNIFCMADMLI